MRNPFRRIRDFFRKPAMIGTPPSKRPMWHDPAVLDADDLDHQALFDVHREATAKVIRKAMRREPTIDWLLENQDKVTHYFHELGIKGEL